MQTTDIHRDDNSQPPEVARYAAPAHRAAMAVLFFPLWVLGGQIVLAQTGLYKCTDGSSITYSSSSCEKIGLKPGGEVRDRLTVVPGAQPAPKSTQPPQKGSAEEEEQRARKAAATVQPINPLIQKLLK